MIQKSIFQFLGELKENNNKPWFDANKASYEVMKKNYNLLASQILEKMKEHDKTLNGLEAKHCVFRIFKDVRFSKDKTPYKTGLGIILTPYGKKMNLAGYYVHLEDGQSFVGGGLYMPPNDLVKKVRSEIQHFPEDLEKILKDKNFIKTYNDIEKNPNIMLAKVPKELSPDHPLADYVRLKSFTTGTAYTNEMVFTSHFVDNVIRDFVTLKPLIHYINRGLMSDEQGAL
ncbi:MAG: DUF2461 domain-containing protein [Saprospiraceae bacterium]